MRVARATLLKTGASPADVWRRLVGREYSFADLVGICNPRADVRKELQEPAGLPLDAEEMEALGL